MEKLFLSLSCLLLFLVPRADAQTDYCSLTVRVQDSQGLPVDVRVRVTKVDGSTLDDLTSDDGTVKFCDLGISPVTISLGSPHCNTLTIKNVHFRWRIEKTLVLTHDPCYSEGGDALSASGCRVLIRAVDQNGVGLPGARVSLNLEGSIDLTDGYGRTFFNIRDGAEVMGVVAKAGYSSGRFFFQCRPDSKAVDRVVVLKK